MVRHPFSAMQVLHVQVLTAGGAPLVDAPASLPAGAGPSVRGDELSGLVQSMRMLARELGAGDFLSMRLDRGVTSGVAGVTAVTAAGGVTTGASRVGVATTGEASAAEAVGAATMASLTSRSGNSAGAGVAGGVGSGSDSGPSEAPPGAAATATAASAPTAASSTLAAQAVAIAVAVDVFFAPAPEGTFAALLVLALPAADASGAALPVPPSTVSAGLAAITEAFRLHGLPDADAVAAMPAKQQPAAARLRREAATARVLPALAQLLLARAGLQVDFAEPGEAESEDG